MTPIRMARFETGVRVIIKLIECFNQHSAQKMTELFSEEVTFDDFTPAPGGSVYTGRALVLDYFKAIFQRCPMMILETEELFGYGHRCILRWKIKQDQKAETPACKRGLTIFLVRNDQICEMLSYAKL